jgi:23S rRNA pseudouridine1911/1915/1917 synthase
VKSNYKVKLLMCAWCWRILLWKSHCSENIPLDIVYEDDTLLLINKKPGMVVHRTWKLYRDFSSCFGISFW